MENQQTIQLSIYTIYTNCIWREENGEYYRGYISETNAQILVQKLDKQSNNFTHFIQMYDTQRPQIHITLPPNFLQLTQSLDHKYILKHLDLIEENQFYLIIYEYPQDSILLSTYCWDFQFDRKRYLSEEEALLYFNQLMEALEYLHDKNIAHLNLKPSNFLIVPSQKRAYIINFTNICQYKDQEERINSNQIYFAPLFCSPQRLIEDTFLPQKHDIWSMGISLFYTLYGRMPWDVKIVDRNYNDLIQWLKLYKKQPQIDFPDNPSQISYETKELLQKMLNYNENQRCTASQYLQEQLAKQILLSFIAMKKVVFQNIKRVDYLRDLYSIN